MENEYKFMLIDGSYFLTRYFMASRYNDDFCKESLSRMFFYGIAKYLRDYHSADKIIIAWDRWSPDVEGYFRSAIINEYKGDRVYETEEGQKQLEEQLAKDQEKSEEEKKAELEAYELNVKLNKIKSQAKYWIIDQFKRFGIPSFYKPGYEADDIAKVFSDYLEDDDRKSCIVSVDSDWDYLINKNVDHVHPKTGKVVTYNNIMEQEEWVPKKLDISLYKFKSFIDSLYGSHNHIIESHNAETTMCQPHEVVIGSILKGEDKFIGDKGLFEANMKSFEIENFPEFDKLQKMMYFIDKTGEIAPSNEFANFSLLNGLGIQEAYYSRFVSTLDTRLYCGT